jgi:hypothetical protein
LSYLRYDIDEIVFKEGRKTLMNLLKNSKIFLILMFIISSFSGCTLLQVPGAILGGASHLLGVAVEVAKKVPWWMWL